MIEVGFEDFGYEVRDVVKQEDFITRSRQVVVGCSVIGASSLLPVVGRIVCHPAEAAAS